MRTPTPAQLLEVWERAADAPVAAGCLALLAACCEGCSDESLASLPLGRRDALLLDLRARLFGAQLCGVVDCPACGTTVEAELGCDELLARAGSPFSSPSALEHCSSAHGLRVRFRVPDSNDLLAIENCSGPAAARQILLERCVLGVEGGRGRPGPDALPPALQAEIAQAMAAADPHADLQLVLACPQCAHRWQPVFDIARFLWQELHAWALRTLRDVDTLAQAYHWAEADILALSPRRRQAYLELCLS
jgi:hypothetical protein